LAVLDRYPECFSDVPGLTDVIRHSIPSILKHSILSNQNVCMPIGFRKGLNRK